MTLTLWLITPHTVTAILNTLLIACPKLIVDVLVFFFSFSLTHKFIYQVKYPERESDQSYPWQLN